MRPSGTLALVARADAASADVTELLRMVAALVAADQPVRLVCVGAGRDALADEAELSEEGRRYLDAVAGFGVVPAVLDARAVLEALAGARDVMRTAPVDRSGDPPLLAIDAAWIDRARADPDAALDALIAAGQVVRHP